MVIFIYHSHLLLWIPSTARQIRSMHVIMPLYGKSGVFISFVSLSTVDEFLTFFFLLFLTIYHTENVKICQTYLLNSDREYVNSNRRVFFFVGTYTGARIVVSIIFPDFTGCLKKIKKIKKNGR